MRTAGIIAAGEGSRFKKAGIMVHKPLIPINGFPLIGHTLRNFEKVGIKKAVVIFNEDERECVRWVKSNFPRLLFQFIVKSTKSSYESFQLVGKKCGLGRHLITTVDSICAPEDLRKMVQVRGNSGNRLYLGVTSYVDDEKPLWVQMNRKTCRITALGTESGRYATAGFYQVPHTIFNVKPKIEISSLREYLKWLLLEKVKMAGVVLSDVVDVDRPQDIRYAEKMLRSVPLNRPV